MQALRGVAAMAVVLTHAAEVAARGGQARWLSADAASPGGAGVDLFFVISGFIIGTVSGVFAPPGGRTPESPGTFLRRRIERLVPLYWLYTTAVLALCIAAPAAFHSLRPDALHTLASYLFVPWPRADGTMQPVLLVGWSLNMEMLFYALVAGALALPRALAVPFLVAGLALLGLFAWDLYLEFLYGLLIASLAARGLRLGSATGWTLFALGFVLIGAFDEGLGMREPRAAVFGLPAAMIVLAAVGMDFRVPKALHLLGDASYSIYLSHLFTINLALLLLRRGGVSLDLAIVLAVVLAALLGVAAYYLIERPLLGFMRRRRPTPDYVSSSAALLTRSP